MNTFDPEASKKPTAAAVFNAEAFRDRVYGVTGAGQRIGKSLAQSLAQLEARLVLVDVNPDTLERTADELRAAGADVRAVVGDVAERETIDRAVDAAMEAWGRVDGWVNNVGVNPRAGLAEQTDAEAAHIWQVNVEAARRAVQRLMPVMKEQGRGAIINVSSILAHQTRARDAAYAGTKGALEALTRAWAMELGEFGIRVNCVRPGGISGARHFGEGELGALRRRAYELRLRANEPRQQPTLPRDVANAVIFLLSDAAAALTGTVLPVDGGTSVEFRHITDHPERIEARRELTKLRERIRELEAREAPSTE